MVITKNMNWIKIARVLLIQIFIALIFVITLEYAARLIFEEKETHFSFRLGQPEPYQDANYFSNKFIEEASAQPGGWILDEKYTGVKPKNYNGTWINVIDNKRVTINDTTLQFKNSIYLFGGSTVYNGEVPDSYTIASQLALIGANKKSFRVINMGASSIHAGQQLGRLKSEVALTPNDVVIFYDGVNDVFERIVYENKEGFMVGKPKKESLHTSLLRKYSNHSKIIEIIFYTVIEKERKISSSYVNSSINDYLQTLDQTNEYVKMHGATLRPE